MQLSVIDLQEVSWKISVYGGSLLFKKHASHGHVLRIWEGISHDRARIFIWSAQEIWHDRSHFKINPFSQPWGHKVRCRGDIWHHPVVWQIRWLEMLFEQNIGMGKWFIALSREWSMWSLWNVKSVSSIFKRLTCCSPLAVTAYIYVFVLISSVKIDCTMLLEEVNNTWKWCFYGTYFCGGLLSFLLNLFHCINHLAKDNCCNIFCSHTSICSSDYFVIIRVHFCRRDWNVPFMETKMKLGVPLYWYTIASSLRMQSRPLL